MSGNHSANHHAALTFYLSSQNVRVLCLSLLLMECLITQTTQTVKGLMFNS